MEPVLRLPQPRRALGELDEDHVAGGGEVQPLPPRRDGNDEHAAALVGVELRQPRGPETSKIKKRVGECGAPLFQQTSVCASYACNSVIYMLGEGCVGVERLLVQTSVCVVYAFNKPVLSTSFGRGVWSAYAIK